MNVVAKRLFQPASTTLAGALLALIMLALVLASGMGVAPHPIAQLDVSPFRWA